MSQIATSTLWSIHLITQATDTNTPPGDPSWLRGVYEVDFVVIAALVGAVLFAASVYLIRRLLPPTP